MEVSQIELFVVILTMVSKEENGNLAYGCVETVGGMENFLTKDNAKDGGMLPQTQNQIFVFKMIHCNGNMMIVIVILNLIVLIYVFE